MKTNCVATSTMFPRKSLTCRQSALEKPLCLRANLLQAISELVDFVLLLEQILVNTFNIGPLGNLHFNSDGENDHLRSALASMKR